MRHVLLSLGSFIILLFLLQSIPQEACAQNSSSVDENGEESDDVVRVVRFSGNRDISDSALRTLVRTENNREFLGIPRFTPWYYLWQAFGIGESPAYLDRETVGNDIERINVYYENLGYFETSVDTSIIEYKKNRVEVSFIIDEGPRSRISSVSYTGLPQFDDPELIPRFYSDSEYNGSIVNDSTIAVNEPYLVQKLRREQTRIITFLKNNGYASAQRDSVNALAKPVEEGANQYDILFSIQPGRSYTFGDVHITLSGPQDESDFDESRSFTGEPYTVGGRTIFVSKHRTAQTKFSLLTEQIRYTPGETFDQSAFLQSVNSFQNLGMMLTNRFALNEERSIPDYSKDAIPSYFDLQTVPRHSIRAEFFGMRRYGFGSGLGLNYNNNNLRGRADNFSIGLNTSLEYVTSGTLREIAPSDGGTQILDNSESTIFQSYEVSTEYTLPRLNFPFQRFRNRSWVQSARTRYALTYGQSNQLFFDINSDIRFNTRYEVNHSNRLTSLFDLVEMDIIDSDPSSQFLENLEAQFTNQPIVLARIEEDFRPQFSSIIRYTLRNRNTNLIKRNFGYSSEFSIAFAGNVPFLLDRYVFSAGTTDQTLPSPFGISSNALAYSRFIKLSADYRRYIPLSENTVFAFRGFAGFAHPVFESDNIPLNRRFFAGGSNDIRGWDSFRLGPGNIISDEAPRPGGDIKLALFKELRQIFLRDVWSSNWHIAWHTDAGNVWYGPKTELLDEDGNDLLEDGRFFIDDFYNQIAVGSGLGLRFDWEFMVVRFDFTYRIHDLEEGWFEDPGVYFSFGIGHSF